jgi:hypothetical protein
MLSMFSAHILDSKVINYKAEGDGATCVGEETVGVVVLDVAVVG